MMIQNDVYISLSIQLQTDHQFINHAYFLCIGKFKEISRCYDNGL